jgi:pentatricopeptide repeat protein
VVDVPANTAVVQAYVRHGRLQEAWHAFDEMRLKGRRTWSDRLSLAHWHNRQRRSLVSLRQAAGRGDVRADDARVRPG